MAKYQRKAQARLDKRIKAHEESGGKSRSNGFDMRKPGSLKKKG